MATQEFSGPINFTVFAIPTGSSLEQVSDELQRLATTHAAEILDVERIGVDADGRAVRRSFDGAAEALGAAETDLLEDDDLAAIVAELLEGEDALVVVYEDRTLAALAAGVAQMGGRETLAGSIDVAQLDRALETQEEGID